VIRARSQAREAALKVLYQLDLRPDVERSELEELVREDVPAADAREFARELIDGTREQLPAIDREIESVAINWNLKRMAVIDRNILRLGTYELLFRPELPAAVSINEAVMLAKKYSTKESGGFVNGILDKVHRRHPGEKRGSGAPDPTAAATPGADDEDAPSAE